MTPILWEQLQIGHGDDEDGEDGERSCGGIGEKMSGSASFPRPPLYFAMWLDKAAMRARIGELKDSIQELEG